MVRLKDVGRVELAALDYSVELLSRLDPAVALAMFQLPGSNALATAKDDPQDDGRSSPSGFRRGSNTRSSTIRPSSSSSRSTPSSRRSSRRSCWSSWWWSCSCRPGAPPIIPLVAIPVSLIGTFFLMAMFGFSLNNLSLFGLVLAVGIVVDDAIVVVENVERNIADGLSPRDAAHKSMDEVGARWSRSRSCCARCSCRRRSSPASPGSSTGSSR